MKNVLIIFIVAALIACGAVIFGMGDYIRAEDAYNELDCLDELAFSRTLSTGPVTLGTKTYENQTALIITVEPPPGHYIYFYPISTAHHRFLQIPAGKFVLIKQKTTYVSEFTPTLTRHDPYKFDFSYSPPISEAEYQKRYRSPPRLAYPVLGRTEMVQTPKDGAKKGYRGWRNWTSSHNWNNATDNTYAVDIRAPIGTEVVAATDGVVVTARDYFRDIGCPLKSSRGKLYYSIDNKLVILTNDGLLISYHHLMKSSILVVPGQRVKKGQRVAMVGRTGTAKIPHLHIQVDAFIENQGYKTLPFIFEDCKNPSRSFVPTNRFYKCSNSI